MRGRTLAFPRNRRLVLDICQAARSVPTFPVERILQLYPVHQARQNSPVRISWVALFLRAYGLVSQVIPELRQVFVTYPWNRLYEHPHAVASISIHREDPEGGKRLIWARINQLEEKGLQEIQGILDQAVTGPLHEVFRDGVRMERIPTPLRRLSWWLAMRWHGRQKAKKIGTCSISTLAGENTLNRFHPLIVTTSLAYARCDASGACLVTLLADHRVLDGMLAAQILHRIEHTLNHQITDELRQLSLAPAPSPTATG
jgi:hypothetical protein